MVNAAAVALKLDWRGWLVGMLGAVISGAASAGAGLSVGLGLKKMGILASVSAIVSLAKYLQLQPSPAKD